MSKGLEDRTAAAPREIVKRVVTAYQAAKRDQKHAPRQYQANGEWTGIIERKVQAFDLEQSGAVLANFFRNQAFEGLSDYATPSHLRSRLSHVHFINNMLHDYRAWCELIGEDLSVLQTPWIGNPFGYFIEGTLTIPASFRHHYMAKRVISLLQETNTCVEIGGGYGELAYFVLQTPGVHYCDFDLPEVLMVASYWLCSALPDRRIALYGENDPNAVLNDLSSYDAVLFPNFSMPSVPDSSVDVVINTRSLSEMEPETIGEYMRHISRCSVGYFVHENSDKPQEQYGHREVVASSFPVQGFQLLSKTLSPWRAGCGRHREFLYQRNDASFLHGRDAYLVGNHT